MRNFVLYHSFIFQESFIYDRFDNSITFIRTFCAFIIRGYKNIKISSARKARAKKIYIDIEKNAKLNLCLSAEIFDVGNKLCSFIRKNPRSKIAQK